MSDAATQRLAPPPLPLHHLPVLNVQNRFFLATCKTVSSLAGIVKAMWQGLKMRTMYHRNQKRRDVYCGFILYNMCLEAREDLANQYDWQAEQVEYNVEDYPAEVDAAAKAAGAAFREWLINQMWVERTLRKAGGM